MMIRRAKTGARRGERGYALLVVVFLITCLLVAIMAASPSILTEGRREKEKEMVWRGKQYTRGVKLYYRKLGRFPTSMDDLTKPKLGSLRFMRQPFKDPMNQKDGTWRFIYVGSAGQLIGSLKPPQNIQLPQAGGMGAPATGAIGSAPGAPALPGSSGFSGQGGTPPPGAIPGGAPSGTNPPGGTGTGTATGTDNSGGPNDPMANPPAGSSSDTSNLVGGNIIGVGSKINKRSIMVYEKAKNYKLFEFIWDPSKDNMGMGQPGMQTGTGLGQNPVQTPPGTQPGLNPSNPMPGGPPQNLPQNPQQPQNPPPQP